MPSQTRHRTWASMFPAILAALAIGGCEARPHPWGNEIPIATAPSLTRPKEVRPTPFNFVREFVEKRLRKRDEYPESVCGFIGGDVASPAVCSSNSACLWDSAHGAVGCSATNDDAPTILAVYTTCVDSKNENINSLKNNPWVFTCASECYRNSYESVSGRGYTQWGCGSSDFATTVLTQPSGVDGQSAKVALTSIDMTTPPSSSSSEPTSSSEPPSSSTSEPPSTTSSQGLSSSTSSESSTSPGSSSSSGGGGGGTTSTGNNPSSTSGGPSPTNSTGTSSPVPGGDSSTNTGAIAGGVVGGVAAIALLAGLLFLLRKRRNKQNLNRVSEASSSNLPHDMGEVYEPKELDATTPEIPSELPGDSPMPGPSKPVAEPVELPGSEVPPMRLPGASEKV